MEYILGVHIPIPPKLAKLIVSVKSKNYINYPGNYKYQPHITIYLCRFTKEKFRKLLRNLKTNNIKSFVLKIGKLKQQSDGKILFIYLSLVKNEYLISFHKYILKMANPLRGMLIRSKDKIKIKSGDYTNIQKRYLLKYGYHRVLKFFIPHITLGELAANDIKKLKHLKSDLNKLKGIEFRINYYIVGLYKYDIKKKDYCGTVIEEKIDLIFN